MNIVKKVKKTVTHAIIAIACALLVHTQVYCISQQTKTLMHTISSFAGKHPSQRKAYLNNKYHSNRSINSLREAFALILRKEAAKLGLHLKTSCTKKGIWRGYEYTVHGSYNGSCIVTITVKMKKNGSSSTYVHINPNCDGCIIDVKTGQVKTTDRYAYFKKDYKTVNTINEKKFKKGSSKNYYRVKAMPCLKQPKSGCCGYYSIFHLLRLFEGKSLLNRSRFNSLFSRNYRNSKTSYTNDMKYFIKNKLPQLDRRNVMISCNSIDQTNGLCITFGTHSNNLKKRIESFQKYGKSQYIIASTSSKTSISGLKLNWSNRQCLTNHWIALKIEWENSSKPGKCPVKITVADSGRPKDNRYAALIHWYYYLFTHKYNYY